MHSTVRPSFVFVWAGGVIMIFLVCFLKSVFAKIPRHERAEMLTRR